ncbi:hypothetical protein POM88_049287 [Heracleum sosnowskyi]|uniref:Uncharacterized protein n=1 Tax=Heracleum sosnowskyi TaxID=360622 RepID=A0AAD8GWM4_9APIA|nr:hypothetical protein POM88_049287 [Heracleum sosnowskyi]
MMMRNSSRNMKICNSDIYYNKFVSSKNYYRATTISSYLFTSSSFNSITQLGNSSSCYFQTAPYSSFPAMEGTKGEVEFIKKGDVVNLNDLLFTKHRDYLVKYNHHQQVKAAHLAGKVIVLYFVPLLPDCSPSRSTSSLIDTYTYLLPDNNFEEIRYLLTLLEKRW